MRSAEVACLALALGTLIASPTPAAEPQYGKVETFQPGKKYTCVPTADHKGWDCNEIAPGNAPGKQGSNVPSAETTPLPAPTAASTPEPSPAAPDRKSVV